MKGVKSPARKRQKKAGTGATIKKVTPAMLESLGYEITDKGLENKKRQLRIVMLQRLEDGSAPDFCYCEQLSSREGFILPHPFAYYADRLPTRKATGQ